MVERVFDCPWKLLFGLEDLVVKQNSKLGYVGSPNHHEQVQVRAWAEQGQRRDL